MISYTWWNSIISSFLMKGKAKRERRLEKSHWTMLELKSWTWIWILISVRPSRKSQISTRHSVWLGIIVSRQILELTSLGGCAVRVAMGSILRRTSAEIRWKIDRNVNICRKRSPRLLTAKYKTTDKPWLRSQTTVVCYNVDGQNLGSPILKND